MEKAREIRTEKKKKSKTAKLAKKKHSGKKKSRIRILIEDVLGDFSVQTGSYF